MTPKARRIPSYEQLVRKAGVAKAWEGFGTNHWDTIDRIRNLYEVEYDRVLEDVKAIEHEAAIVVYESKGVEVDRWIRTGNRAA